MISIECAGAGCALCSLFADFHRRRTFGLIRTSLPLIRAAIAIYGGAS